MLSRYCTLAALCGLLAVSSQGAHANFVVNGGFETGDFTGWSLSNSTNDTVTSSAAFVHSGTYGVSHGRVGSDSFLYQTIATVAGQSYTFDFYQKTLAGTPNDFQAYWGGALILDSSNSPVAADWTHYSFTEAATSSATEIRFGLRQDPSFSALDDVSVNPSAVPEPASLVMLGTGVVSMLGYGWRRRRWVR